MTPLVVACLVTLVGCVLHFVFTQPNSSQPTLACLGDWTILAGVLSITFHLTGSM